MISISSLRTQSDLIHSLLAMHKCVAPRVFGSVIAGTNTEDSDVDLLVDPLPGTSMLDIVKLEHDLTHAFGVRFEVHLSTGLDKRWRQSVLGSAVPL